MFEHQNHRKKTEAVLAVAVLMMCCFLPLCTAGGDATDTGATYDIYMRTGQTFTYTPQVNLDDTDISVDTTESSGITDNDWTYEGTGDELSVSFDAIPTNGLATLALKAFWQSPTEQVSQTVYQYINFHIYGHVAINGMTGISTTTNAVTGYIIGDDDDFEYAVSLGSSPAGTTVTAEKTSGTDDVLIWDSTNKKIVVKDGAELAEGTYKFTITATHSVSGTSLVEETAKVYLTVLVGEDLAITSPDAMETFVSDTNPANKTYTVTTNYEDDNDYGLTIERWAYVPEGTPTGYDEPPTGFFTVSEDNEAVISWDPSKVQFADDVTAANAFKKFAFVANAIAETADGEELPIVYKTVSVTVWADLVFTSEPTIDNVTIVTNGNNPLDAKMTAVFSNAKKIVIEWGDGTHTTYDNQDGALNKSYTFNHEYGQGRLYSITVTATNDNGSTTATAAYNAVGDAVVHTVTLKDKDGSTVGTVTVAHGQKVDLANIVFSSDYSMDGKEIKGLFADSSLSTAFDSAIVEDKTLYVDIGEKFNFLWIIFLILTIIFALLFFFFGIQTFYVGIPMVVCLALTVLLFLYGDFAGIVTALGGGLNP